MSKRNVLFWAGGFVMILTVIAFLYVVLFRNETSFMQWLAAILIFILGGVAIALGWEEN